MKILAVCPRCDGEGKITIYNLTTKKHVVIDCPRCGGDGTIIPDDDPYIDHSLRDDIDKIG